MADKRMIAQYEITGLVGEGGVGQVYAALDTILGREVAIKRLRPALLADKTVVDRFRAEAVSLARLNHQNITTLYSLIDVDGVPHMVMELVRGKTLDAIIHAKGGPLEPAEALAIVAQVADGLTYAHAHGIIHRDIKPANLMVTDSGLVKITDFGIARLHGSQHLTRDGSTVGTLAYMAPEQLRSEDTDARTDLYSLAIVLYEMLSGTVPFSAANDYDLMRCQINDLPPRFASRVVGVEPHVEKAILKALSKKPSDRFSSVADFKAALQFGKSDAESLDVVRKATRLIEALPAVARSLPKATLDKIPRTPLFSVVRGVAIGATIALAATGALLLSRRDQSLPIEPAPLRPAAPNHATAGSDADAAAPRRGNPPFPLGTNSYQYPVPGTSGARHSSEFGQFTSNPRSRSVDASKPQVVLQSTPVSGPAPTRSYPPSDARSFFPDARRLCDLAAASPLDKDRPANVKGVLSEELDASKAVPACEAAVEAAPDDARLLYQLGRAYGAAKAYDRSLAAYKKAGELGNVLATNNIGDMYNDGVGVEKNEEEGFRWLQRAASEGVPMAMRKLGVSYEKGLGTVKDYAEARHWYERAANSGDVDALLKIGDLYAKGAGVTQDYSEAWRWYEKAAVQGHAGAMFELGRFSAAGLGVTKSYVEARRWYEQAARLGNSAAMNNLGVLYQRGEGGERDLREARRLYERAAAGGNSVALRNVGVLYQSGLGVPKDFSEARRWYEKSAAVGDALAMTRLGMMYHNGVGVPKDLDEARRWYNKAVTAGDSEYAPALLRGLERGGRRRRTDA